MMHKAGQNIAQQQWEEVGRKTGLIPRKKITHKLGEIYLAEGFIQWHEDMQEPHWLTSWAVARGDSNIKAFSYFRSGRNTSHLDRLTTARQDAERALQAAYEREQLRAKDARLLRMKVAGEA